MSRGRKNNAQPAAGRWRSGLVMGAVLAGALLLAGRAIDLQVMDQAFLTKQGDMRYTHIVTIPASRGALLDRRGRPLALSAPVESVWSVPRVVLKSPKHLNELARLLGRKTSSLRAYLHKRKGRDFVYLKRHMHPAAARRIKALGVPGVFLQREYQRYYPAGEAAAQLVGITNIDDKGLEGMELALNSRLQG